LSDAREKLFDEWAETYDRSVEGPVGFPFEGYERVLDLVAERSGTGPGTEVLDLGIGTGNLAGRMLERGCVVWGLDFSLRMLTKVHEKYPQIELINADIKGDWPIDVDERFGGIVSAYVLHEFDLESKVRLIRKLTCDHLVPGGRVVVGDISFETRESRDGAERRFSGSGTRRGSAGRGASGTRTSTTGPPTRRSKRWRPRGSSRRTSRSLSAAGAM